MQSYDGFWLIPNFFFHFFSKALDKDPGFGQIAEMMSIPVQKIRRKRTDAETQGHRVICYFHVPSSDLLHDVSIVRPLNIRMVVSIHSFICLILEFSLFAEV